MARSPKPSNGKPKKGQVPRLPTILRSLFWEYNFRSLSWEKDRDFIVARILSVGTSKAVHWLRTQMKDADLAQWIVRRRGRGLSPKQMRFWELLLDLPHDEVDLWLVDGDQTY
jgi:hypothetical protein